MLPDGIRRVCVLHPGLGIGGSEARALALLEMLQGQCELTFLTAEEFDLEKLNQAYNCNVDGSKIDVHIAPIPQLLRRISAGDALRSAFFTRFVRRMGKSFDLCISSYNFSEFGRPAIQFVADFMWDDEMRWDDCDPSSGLRGILQRPNPARRAYLAIADLIAGGRPKVSDHKDDVIIANSDWSANILRQRHGLRSDVIYPPVYAPPMVSDVARCLDFVILGRISPEKRIIDAIDVLRAVRERGHRVHLHVIGPAGPSNYAQEVTKHVKRHADWVHLRGGLYGNAKFVELERHTFGIHMRRYEAFGIAVAEMLKMGVVPFVSEGGAPAEIVADERLIFRNQEHAVHLIDSLLRNRSEITALRGRMLERADVFSKKRFVEESRALIERACTHLTGSNGHVSLSDFQPQAAIS